MPRDRSTASEPLYKARIPGDAQDAPPDVEAEIAALARRYRGAGGPGLKLLTMVGGTAEDLLNRLPKAVRDRLDPAAELALKSAVRAAQSSRALVADRPGWVERAVTTGMGAAGGFGGLPTALAELPLTTTMLLRQIQGIAAEHGFDPAEENVMFDSIQVFASAGPLARDDGADTAFLAARVTLSGAAVHGLIARVAPRLATVMGQKLAAQTIPVLGAAAGAATNLAYSSYYREMAHVHFGLRRLAIEADRPPAELVEALRAEVTRRPIRKA